jgi:hypothetical protein
MSSCDTARATPGTGAELATLIDHQLKRTIIRMKMHAMLRSERTYQATDLARNHRQVVDDARAGVAVIRDKDGTALVMTAASRLERANDIGGTAVSLVQLWQVLAEPVDRRTTAAYGDFAWLRVLPEESQRRFVAEMTDRLLIAASGGRLDQLTQLVGDWLATAEAWADSETREALLTAEPEPTRDVEL